MFPQKFLNYTNFHIYMSVSGNKTYCFCCMLLLTSKKYTIECFKCQVWILYLMDSIALNGLKYVSLFFNITHESLILVVDEIYYTSFISMFFKVSLSMLTNFLIPASFYDGNMLSKIECVVMVLWSKWSLY